MVDSNILFSMKKEKLTFFNFITLKKGGKSLFKLMLIFNLLIIYTQKGISGKHVLFKKSYGRGVAYQFFKKLP